jgi:membrane protein
VMALAVLVTGFLTGVSGFGPIGTLMRIGAFVLGTVINVALFSLAFRLATAREVVTRHLLPGAAVSAVLWQLLLAFGGLLIAHQVRHAQSVYGVFGVVLGLLGWLHLQAQITLYAVEFDNVRVRRLWPRSVAQPPLTRADKHAYDAYAQTQRRRPDEEERIDVTFTDNDPSAPPQDAEPDPK